MSKRDEVIRSLLDNHYLILQDYPLNEIQMLDQGLYNHIVFATGQRDKAIFRDDLTGLLTEIETVEELYLQAAEKYFSKVKR